MILLWMKKSSAQCRYETLDSICHIINPAPTVILWEMPTMVTSKLWHNGDWYDYCDRNLWLISTRLVLTLEYSGQTHFKAIAADSLAPCIYWLIKHDADIKWKHFLLYWPFGRGIHRLPVNSPHKGQWRGTFMFSLICAWINGWVNNRKAGDLRCHHAHYDIIVMVKNNFPLLCIYIYW